MTEAHGLEGAPDTKADLENDLELMGSVFSNVTRASASDLGVTIDFYCVPATVLSVLLRSPSGGDRFDPGVHPVVRLMITAEGLVCLEAALRSVVVSGEGSVQ